MIFFYHQHFGINSHINEFEKLAFMQLFIIFIILIESSITHALKALFFLFHNFESILKILSIHFLNFIIDCKIKFKADNKKTLFKRDTG